MAPKKRTPQEDVRNYELRGAELRNLSGVREAKASMNEDTQSAFLICSRS